MITPEALELINKLAVEDNVTISVFLEKLLLKEDQERHSDWDRKSQSFKRIPCSRKNCFIKP